VFDLCFRHCGEIPFLPLRANLSGTDRTTALSSSGAGVNNRFPDVPFRTLPPDFFPTSRRYLLGCQGSVQFLVPLCRDLRRLGLQVIESRQNFPSCAVWTARMTGRSGRNNGGILMLSVLWSFVILHEKIGRNK